MNSLPIASLALVLALSGCSSSPSVEEQTKLIEYERCLEWQERMRDREISVMASLPDEDYVKRMTRDQLGTNLSKLTYEKFLAYCESYRP